MELLRIISMLMVLAVHIDGASLGLPQISGNFENINAEALWRLRWESFTIVGVNCFTLISGYFGIRLSWRGVLSYLFQCVFYSVGIYMVMSAFGFNAFSLDGWLESWLVLTHTDLWYVPAYFALMLLSPFINAAFSTLPRRMLFGTTLAFVIFNIWAGWFWGGNFNPTGYTVVQLIMMYMIGRCTWMSTTNESGERTRMTIHPLWFLAGYIFFSFATFVVSLYNTSLAFAYNSPMVILASWMLFGACLGRRFKSALVNYLARSAFAVYLIHKSPLIWGNHFKPFVLNLWETAPSLWTFTLYALLIMACVYILVVPIDCVRRFFSNSIFRQR